MAPTRTSARIFAHAERTRMKVVAVGDAGQLASVEAGGWFAALSRSRPGPALREVIRQRDPAERAALEAVLYLTRAARTRDVTLPGLTVRTRPGIGPVDGDILLPGGVYQASVARGLVDNLLPSRSTHGRPGRTFDRRELGDWIDRLARVYGTRRLLEFRSEAEQLAPTLEVEPSRVRQLSDLIGAAVGTRTVAGVDSPALAARQASLPYDGDRVARLELLADALRASAPQNRPADPSAPRWLHLPFFEAYFSNYIEGTAFPLDVAERVVYQGEVPPARPADAHDLTGTYEIVNDLAEMSAVASDATQFLEILGHRHQVVMAGRPETAPGQFKLDANRAGATEFVAPTLVEGTLRTGFDRLASLDTAWERSVYTMFLVSEVHPFNEGNGRIARIMMNAELVAGGQARMIIPTVFRDDYLGALRRLTRSDDPSILIKALRFTHDYTANIDFSSVRVATEQLSDTNAFDDPDGQARLRQPAATPAIASRRTVPPGAALRSTPTAAPRVTRGPHGLGR